MTKTKKAREQDFLNLEFENKPLFNKLDLVIEKAKTRQEYLNLTNEVLINLPIINPRVKHYNHSTKYLFNFLYGNTKKTTPQATETHTQTQQEQEQQHKLNVLYLCSLFNQVRI